MNFIKTSHPFLFSFFFFFFYVSFFFLFFEFQTQLSVWDSLGNKSIAPEAPWELFTNFFSSNPITTETSSKSCFSLSGVVSESVI